MLGVPANGYLADRQTGMEFRLLTTGANWCSDIAPEGAVG
jgi:hypothetical protein